MEIRSEQEDVVVIGAGISGLCAARCLHEDYGLKVTVLEARDRVGGRTFTIKDPDNNLCCDLGGAYLGTTQTKILSLVEKLGIDTYKIFAEGIDMEYYLGQKGRKCGGLPGSGLSLITRLDLNNYYQCVDKMAKQVPLHAPWLAPLAAEWDHMTFKEHIEKTCWTRTARSVASCFVQGMLAAEPHDFSLLYFLWYLHSGGGIRRNYEVDSGGAQEMKLVGGTQQISEKLAALLGDRVKLESVVNGIEQFDNYVKVTCTDGTECKASYVISSVPPTLLRGIRFQPSLPALKNQGIQRMPMGSIIKTITYYRTPFWRDKGCSGFMNSDVGPVEEAYDDTKPDGSHPALMGFIVGDRARQVTTLTKDERIKKVCEEYAFMFNSDEALQPVRYLEKNWLDDEFAGGCYVATCPPGVLTKYGKAMREPSGRVYFAGTMIASVWAGYMEGAVESGERAAVEVLQRLGYVSAEEKDSVISLQQTAESEFFEYTFTEKYLMPSVPGLAVFAVLGSALLGTALVCLYRHR